MNAISGVIAAADIRITFMYRSASDDSPFKLAAV